LLEEHGSAEKDPTALVVQEGLEKYFTTYLKLIELVAESKLNEEWFFRIVGWYNLQPLLRTMTEKMLLSSSKRGHVELVQSLSWMRPHRYRPLRTGDFYEFKREERMVDTYYKKLNLSHEVSFLRSVESIIGQHISHHKGRHYSDYADANLPRLLSRAIVASEELDDVVWLLGMYVRTFNDKQQIIGAFEAFVKTEQPRLSPPQIEILTDLYSRTGNIDPDIYKIHIRPHLLQRMHKDVEQVVEVLEFVLQSEANDATLINDCLREAAKKVKEGEVADEMKNKLHCLLHYMKVKKINFEVSTLLAKELDDCCRTHEGNGSVARMMAVELDERGRQ
jgi:hypothetical protein